MNRAGFGGTPSEIDKLASLGQESAVSSLLDYETTPDPVTNPEWAHPDPDRMQRQRDFNKKTATPEERRQFQREQNQFIQKSMVELRGWWLRRMAYGPRHSAGSGPDRDGPTRDWGWDRGYFRSPATKPGPGPARDQAGC